MPVREVRLDRVVQAARAGDEHAWNALVGRFTPLLRHVTRGFRLDPDDADDVVQACWLALIEGLPVLREPEALSGWLVTAARRQAMKTRQRETRELLTDDEIGADLAAPDCTEDTVLLAERVSALRCALGRLPGRQRDLLEALLAASDSNYAEVSNRLDMPIGSIGPTRERGLKRLRRDAQLVRAVAS